MNESKATAIEAAQPDAVRSDATPPRARRRWWRRQIAWRRRLAAGAAAGSAASLLLSLLDARWARLGEGTPPSYWRVLSFDAGLVAPLGVGLGLLGAATSLLLHPAGPPRLGALRRWLGSRPTDRSTVAAMALLAPLATLLWLVLLAHLARLLLALDLSPPQCGAALAGSALLGAGSIATAGLALLPSCATAFRRAETRLPRATTPGFTLGATLLFASALMAAGVARGSVSGSGGVLGIFGVLRRAELDLRFPAMLLAVVAAAYLQSARSPLGKTHVAVTLILLPWGLTVRAAIGLGDQATGGAISRHAPLGGRALRRLRRLSDRDGDGASALFGGGDCNDHDPHIGPEADEIAGNSIDEDCSGGDLSAAALQAAASEQRPSIGETDERARPYLKLVPARGNLVLIVIDTLRHDLGFAGYPRHITPQLDALAKRSAVFERAYSLASYTGKSMGPMLMGKYGSETHRNWGHFNKFGPEDIFVAQRFQKAGVHTLSVQGHHYFGRFGGLDRGFDEIDLSAAPEQSAAWATDATTTSDKLTDAAIKHLDALPPSERFFLFLDYLDPHADYLQHEGIESFGTGARALYDHEVAFTDREVGRLIDHITAAPWAGRTNIIVTSDHGEAFGEHGMYRHGVELWETLVRVPLIIHVPGATPRRIAARRSLIDLAPTALELMRVPSPGQAKGDDFVSGTSLLPEVLGDPSPPPPARDILIDMPAGPYNEARRAFIHGDLKLIMGGAHKELYDLAKDPGERHNLWSKRHAEIDAHWALKKSRLREIIVTGKRR